MKPPERGIPSFFTEKMRVGITRCVENLNILLILLSHRLKPVRTIIVLVASSNGQMMSA